MTASHKIPATVITGFLGAGKTTLIRHMLETIDGPRLALVINEFGDLGIDGGVLEACGVEGCAEDDVIELANGCICCTVADDFLPTMLKLVDRPDPPDHIVIETSGLALPKPLVQAFNWPEIRTRVTVDGVVAVVDGPAVAEGRFATDPEAVDAARREDESLDHDSPLEELFEDQLACADLVLLNKADLLGEGVAARIEDEVDALLRPGVRVVRTAHGRLRPDVLLGIEAGAEDYIEARRTHHDDEEDHDHDEFESFIVEIGAVAAPETLAGRIEAAVDAHDILRVKGFIDVSGKDMRLVLQGVGRRIQHYYDREWRAGEPRASRLVVIGEAGLDQAAIRAAILG